VRAGAAGFDFALISDHFHPFYEADIIPRLRRLTVPQQSQLARHRAA